MPRAILVFCPFPESCVSLSGQTRSFPQENPHSCIATHSSHQLPWGSHSLAKQSLGHAWLLLSILHKPASPRRGLNTAISSEMPPHGHLLSEAYAWPSLEGHPCTAISSERLACRYIPRDVAVSPARPTGGHLSSEARGASAAMPGTALGHAECGRAQQPSGKIYSQTQV